MNFFFPFKLKSEELVLPWLLKAFYTASLVLDDLGSLELLLDDSELAAQIVILK